MINVNLTQDEAVLLRNLLEYERRRLTNTDYDAEIIEDADEKSEVIVELAYRILSAQSKK